MVKTLYISSGRVREGRGANCQKANL